MDILGPVRGKMTIYESEFQQVNLTPNGGISPTDSAVYIFSFGPLRSVEIFLEIR